jgi:hypothetical protein
LRFLAERRNYIPTFNHGNMDMKMKKNPHKYEGEISVYTIQEN